MRVLQFIAAAVLAASIGALTGYSLADMPQVYQSNSTGEVKGWKTLRAITPAATARTAASRQSMISYG